MDDLYLLYAYNQGGWGVFNAMDCPDSGAFPDWMYRKYEVKKTDRRRVWSKLVEVKDDLVLREILPSRGNTNIFPELSDLLKN